MVYAMLSMRAGAYPEEVPRLTVRCTVYGVVQASWRSQAAKRTRLWVELVVVLRSRSGAQWQSHLVAASRP
jgi:hypothetical protein